MSNETISKRMNSQQESWRAGEAGWFVPGAPQGACPTSQLLLAWGKAPTLFLRSLVRDLELLEIFSLSSLLSPTHFN